MARGETVHRDEKSELMFEDHNFHGVFDAIVVEVIVKGGRHRL